MTTCDEALNQARQLLRGGGLAQAEAIYRRLLKAAPQAADVWHEMGVLQLQAKRPEMALEYLERAIALDSNIAAYHSNLGAAYRAQKRTAEALASFARAVELGPPSAHLSNNLALALKDAGRCDEALVAFDDALAIEPDYANGHFNRGNLLMETFRLDEAIESYQKSIELNPNDAAAHGKLGVTYGDQGRLSEALACYERALELKPDDPEAHRNRAFVWLARGAYSRGWSEYEWRLECAGYAKRTYRQPRWDGSPLAGRTIFVYAEQGLGDTLQFIRYIPLLERAGGRVLLEVPTDLAPLLAQSGFGRWLVEPGFERPFDIHAPLMSLAGLLGDAGPSNAQPYWPGTYLAADPRLARHWRERLSDISGFKVGIAWCGNPDHGHDRFRSVRLAEFAPLAAIPGVRLIRLQSGAGSEQLADLPEGMNVIDLGDLRQTAGAFMDIAAVMIHLDLVISVDTAHVHLAGGLGANVWVPLWLSPDWRWLIDRSDSPWYPSMRLFRQRELNRWRPVFAEMAESLRRLVVGGS